MKNQPRLKKVLAEWLTDDAIETRDYNIRPILYSGHRGFMAMGEKELTDLFDKRYEELDKRLQALKEELAENNQGGWGEERLGEKIKKQNDKLAAAEQVYTEIFEEVFL